MILSPTGQVLMTNSRFLGFRTNNQAEYEAIIAALKFAATLKAEEVICYLDSQLVVKQAMREYRVKNSELEKLWRKVQKLSGSFKKATFVYVPRTNSYIQKADALVNESLDDHC